MSDTPKTKSQLLAELKEAREIISGMELSARHRQGLTGSRETLESIIRNLPHIVYQVDPQGRVRFISPTVARYGYRVEKMVGQPVLDLFHPHDRPKVRFKARERRRGERRTKSMEVRLIPGGGQPGPAEFRVLLSTEGVYSYDQNGSKTFIGTQGIIQDITELKEARQELEIKNNAVDSAISGLALADLEGRLTYLNQAGLEMLGFSRPDEVLNRPVESFTSQRSLARLVTERLGSRQAWTGEIQLVGRDGSLITVQLSANVVHASGGKAVCWLFNFLDITPRKEMEDQLRQARDDLDLRVQERTAELKQTFEDLKSEVLERKKAEEALSRSNDLLEKIFSTTHISLAYLDRNLNFLRVNRRFARQAGHRSSFFEEKNLSQVLTPKTVDLCNQVIKTGRSFIATGQPGLFPRRSKKRRPAGI